MWTLITEYLGDNFMALEFFEVIGYMYNDEDNPFITNAGGS